MCMHFYLNNQNLLFEKQLLSFKLFSGNVHLDTSFAFRAIFADPVRLFLANKRTYLKIYLLAACPFEFSGFLQRHLHGEFGTAGSIV